MINLFNRPIIRGMAAAFFCFLTHGVLFAQMGNDNPTGVAGVYNGNVTTADSYDPYTGNAMRSVTDISVPGAVGAYPLAFTRTMNSRYAPAAGSSEFGPSGSWRHSYQWSIDGFTFQSDAPNKWTVMPSTYTANYPDGRRVSFAKYSNDTMMRYAFGVSDRFQPPTGDEDNCFILLPDGGKVWFTVHIERSGGDQGPVTSTFTYELKGIIDPYGQITTVTYGPSTMIVREPGGRTLTAYYISTPWNGDVVIDRVVSSDGRSVKYNFGTYQPAGATTYTALGNVQYLDTNAAFYAQAIYAYQPGNADANGRPLLSWAIDPMYGGPMWAISYSFVSSTEGGVYGQIKSENYLDPLTGTPGDPVSSLSANANSRTETRGDGPSRTFNYSGGQLVSYTDFKNQSTSLLYDTAGFRRASTDARLNTVDLTNEPLTGRQMQVMHPLTPPDTVRASAQFTYGSATCPDPNNQDATMPYYLFRATNELGNSTTYWRDAYKRVGRVDYADGSYEEFTYNRLGQVSTHRLTSGGTEHFVYDNGSDDRGLLTSYTPPATASDPHPENHPTSFHYYDNDRLWYVVDPRGNKTSYQYNARGQVTKVTHEDNSFIQSEYNVDGTLAWVADENHPNAATDPNQRTRYTYDEYKRVRTVTNPMGETTTYWYGLNPVTWGDELRHTSLSLKYVVSQLNKNVVYDYDENLHRKDQIVALGTADEAWTLFEYDEVGNLKKITDPRLKESTFGYDQRDRKIWMNDPIATHRNNNGHTMEWQYDGAGSLIKEMRADNSFRSWSYDIANRTRSMIDWRMSIGDPAVTTTSSYELPNAANVTIKHVIDPKLKDYEFAFDALRRKISATYPMDANNEQRTERWEYDEAGNLHQFTNRDGATQLFAAYDNRNRPQSFTWSGGTHPTQGTSFTYYDNGNLRTANNDEAEITLAYDDANRLLSETEKIKTYGLSQTHVVNYEYDEDGNRSRLVYPQGYDYRYAYTNRNQLKNIRLAWLTDPTIQYTYDKSGNRLTRTTFGGAGYTDYDFDDLNRLRSQTTHFANHAPVRFDYGFDTLNRIKYEQRDAGWADGFGYDPRSELTGFNQDGTLNADGSVSASYNVSFSYDANGNRIDAFDGSNAHYVTAASNQYTSDWTGTLGYDRNANLTSRAGWTYTYDAQNRLTKIDNNAGTQINQHYDALNRIVARDVNNDPNQTTINVWDGWNLLEERDRNDGFKRMYFHGAATNEIVVSTGPVDGDVFYFQDGRGNTTHVTDGGANLIEEYRYFVSGQPTFYDGSGNWMPNSNKHVRHLFGGAFYLPEAGAEIYDMRNRFYHPNLGRFMQSDPLGFGGGDANLFRYCGDDPVNGRDPSGLVNSNDHRKPPPQKRKDNAGNSETRNFGSNGYTPTGSMIPQSVTGTWNGGSWDLSSHDYVHGTQSLGSFVLLGGPAAGNSAEGGGALFLSTKDPIGRAVELATRALDSDKVSGEAIRSGLEVGGVVVSSGKMHVDDPGTEMMLTIHILPGTIATFHTHHLVGPNPFEFSHPPNGLDSFTLLQQRPNMVHLIGILDGDPGHFTIRAYIPGGEFWQRKNFSGNEPSYPGGG